MEAGPANHDLVDGGAFQEWAAHQVYISNSETMLSQCEIKDIVT